MALDSKTSGARCCVKHCMEFVDMPFVCHKCGETTCEQHRLFDAHECRGFVDPHVPHCPLCGQIVPVPVNGDPNAVVSRHIEKGCPKEGATVSPQPERFNFCSFANCRTNEHVLIRCKFCGNQYCVEHRLQEDHNCVALRDAMAAARARSPAPKATPVSSTSATTRSQWNPAQLTAFFAKGISGHPVVGQQGIEPKDRVSYFVFFPIDSSAAPCVMCFNRNWVVGKVLDKICAHGKIRNENNRLPPEKQFQLFNLKFCVPLPANATLASLEPELQNGDPVMLSQGSVLPQPVIDAVQQQQQPRSRPTAKPTASSCAASASDRPSAAMQRGYSSPLPGAAGAGGGTGGLKSDCIIC